MTTTREVQNRIKSIRDTMKITNAMYMISSTKLRKAKKAIANTEPYFLTLQKQIAQMLYYAPDAHNKYFAPTGAKAAADKRCAYIVITGNKGLAGVYNFNVLKLAQQQLALHPRSRLMVMGEVGRQFFAAKGVPFDYHFQYSADNPNLPRTRVIAATVMEQFESGELDEVYMIYTRMKNSMSAEAELLQLLPLEEEDYAYQPAAEEKYQQHNFYPSADAVMTHVVNDSLIGLIYGAMVESFCSEQNSRMIAMQAANDNAREMLRSLSIQYNSIRQAQITQELTEIVSGAKAQQRKKQQRRQQQAQAAAERSPKQ